MSSLKRFLARWKYVNGWLRLQARRTPSATAYLENAVSLDAKQAKYIRLLGYAYHQNRDDKLAFKTYWKSFDIEFGSIEALHTMAILSALDDKVGLAMAFAVYSSERERLFRCNVNTDSSPS